VTSAIALVADVVASVRRAPRKRCARASRRRNRWTAGASLRRGVLVSPLEELALALHADKEKAPGVGALLEDFPLTARHPTLARWPWLRWHLIGPLEVAALLALWHWTLVEDAASVGTLLPHCQGHARLPAEAGWAGSRPCALPRVCASRWALASWQRGERVASTRERIGLLWHAAGLRWHIPGRRGHPSEERIGGRRLR